MRYIFILLVIISCNSKPEFTQVYNVNMPQGFFEITADSLEYFNDYAMKDTAAILLHLLDKNEKIEYREFFVTDLKYNKYRKKELYSNKMKLSPILIDEIYKVRVYKFNPQNRYDSVLKRYNIEWQKEFLLEDIYDNKLMEIKKDEDTYYWY